MKLPKLPLSLNLKNEAVRKSSYHGIYPSTIAQRLAETVQSIDSDIEVSFDCKYDILQHAIATGVAKVDITLICMRCYEPYQIQLNVPFTFTPGLTSSENSFVDENYIALEYNEFGEVNLLEAIEDELILAIPINPMMEEADCKYGNKELTFGDDLEIDNDQNNVKNNPFAVLSNLKNKLD